MNSLGCVRTEGLIGRPLMLSSVSATIGGPPSIGRPDPSSTRPNIDSDTPRRATSPVKRACVWVKLRLLVHFEHLSEPHLAGRPGNLHDLAVGHAADPFDEDQRPGNPRNRAVLFG